jgi:hypothetical protein
MRGGDKQRGAINLSLLFKNAVTVVERHRRTKQYTVGVRNCVFAHARDPMCNMCAQGDDSMRAGR